MATSANIFNCCGGKERICSADESKCPPGVRSVYLYIYGPGPDPSKIFASSGLCPTTAMPNSTLWTRCYDFTGYAIWNAPLIEGMFSYDSTEPDLLNITAGGGSASIATATFAAAATRNQYQVGGQYPGYFVIDIAVPTFNYVSDSACLQPYKILRGCSGSKLCPCDVIDSGLPPPGDVETCPASCPYTVTRVFALKGTNGGSGLETVGFYDTWSTLDNFAYALINGLSAYGTFPQPNNTQPGVPATWEYAPNWNAGNCAAFNVDPQFPSDPFTGGSCFDDPPP